MKHRYYRAVQTGTDVLVGYWRVECRPWYWPFWRSADWRPFYDRAVAEAWCRNREVDAARK